MESKGGAMGLRDGSLFSVGAPAFPTRRRTGEDRNIPFLPLAVLFHPDWGAEVTFSPGFFRKSGASRQRRASPFQGLFFIAGPFPSLCFTFPRPFVILPPSKNCFMIYEAGKFRPPPAPEKQGRSDGAKMTILLNPPPGTRYALANPHLIPPLELSAGRPMPNVKPPAE